MPDLFKQLLAGNFTAPAGDAGEYSGVSEPILRSLATGKPALSTPRTGFGALLAKTGLVSPTQQVDQRTYDIEQLAIEKKRQMDQMVKMNAIGKFAEMVKVVGGDAAIKMAPDFFGTLLQDNDVVQAFAGIKGWSELRDQYMQNQLQLGQEKNEITQARLDIARSQLEAARERADTAALLANWRMTNPTAAPKDPLLTSIYYKLAADFTIPAEIKTQVYAAIAAGASGREVAGILAEATKPKPAGPGLWERIVGSPAGSPTSPLAPPGTPPSALRGPTASRYPEGAPPPAGMSPSGKGVPGTPDDARRLMSIPAATPTPTLPW